MVSEEEVSDFHQAMLDAGKECTVVIKDRRSDRDDVQKLSLDEVLDEAEDWITKKMQ